MPEKEPTSEVLSTSVESADASGFVLSFQSRVDNPSDRSIPINDIVFDFLIQDEKVLEDRIELSEAVPPGESRTVRFDVPVGWANVAQALANAKLGNGQVSYRFDGKMLLPSTMFVESTPIEFTGELDLAKQVRQAIRNASFANVPELAQLATQLGLSDVGSGMIPDDVPGF